MWHLLTCSLLGIVAGFAAFSRGWFFRRTMPGALTPGLCLFGIAGLAIHASVTEAWWLGPVVFVAAFFVAPALGRKMAD